VRVCRQYIESSGAGGLYYGAVSRILDSLAALSEPEFRKLFIGQATSVVGSMFRVVALPFAVLAIGGSATDIGLVAACSLVPLAVFVLVGGVWADRLPRRMVMLVADLVRMTLQLTAAALLVSGIAEVWQLAVLQVGMGTAEAFFGPAYTGLVPEVVSAPRLQQANALQGLVSSGSITLGATLAGLLVAAVGPGWAIGIDGASYLASAAFLWRLRPAQFLGPAARRPAAAAGPAHALAGEEAAVGDAAQSHPEGFLHDLAEGWTEFRRHTWIWVTAAGAALFLFAVDGPIQVIGPVVANEVYSGAKTWGLTSAAMGIGQIAGGLLSLRWRPKRPILVICAGMSVSAVPVALLALEAPVWALYAAMVAIGIEWGLYDPFWMTCMQRVVPPDMISRVSAYDWFGVLAFYPAGLALAGPLADALGRSTVLWAAAGTALAVSIFQVSWRDVRAPHDMRPPPDTATAAAPPA
jgi:MFS family permease